MPEFPIHIRVPLVYNEDSSEILNIAERSQTVEYIQVEDTKVLVIREPGGIKGNIQDYLDKSGCLSFQTHLSQAIWEAACGSATKQKDIIRSYTFPDRRIRSCGWSKSETADTAPGTIAIDGFATYYPE